MIPLLYFLLPESKIWREKESLELKVSVKFRAPKLECFIKYRNQKAWPLALVMLPDA